MPPQPEGGISGKGLQIWGDIRFRADAVVRADVQGSVRGSEKIIVTEGAAVTGLVEGSDVRIEGQALRGVVAQGRVWIGARAKVRGRCQARAVRIEPGAEFKGEIQVG